MYGERAIEPVWSDGTAGHLFDNAGGLEASGAMRGKRLTAIDLFCGAGGLSLGFERAGFAILAGNDTDPAAGKTFAASHGGAVFFPEPIEKLSGTELLDATGLKPGELDCLAGGPPCQAFSVYNHRRGMHDKRSGLFREYLRVVRELNPKWIVMENVTGITSVGEGAAVAAIFEELGALGYDVEMKVLRAEDFGVPQERRRVFFLGNRIKRPIPWPAPSRGNGKPFVTVWDAIGDLPRLANGEDRGVLPYAGGPQSDFQRLMRDSNAEVRNHAAPKLSAINLERMRHIPQGGSWRDIPFDLLPAGMKRARRCDHTKRYGRLRPEGLASTILTKCDLHWGAFIHPLDDRILTVREAARLQSFPDRVVFHGSRTEQYVQVGNAVPPLLAFRIAKGIAETMVTGKGAKRRAEAPLFYSHAGANGA